VACIHRLTSPRYTQQLYRRRADIHQWTPEQIDNVVRLAKTNFNEGADQLKRTVRAVYERKKKQRLERRQREDERRHGKNERNLMDQFS